MVPDPFTLARLVTEFGSLYLASRARRGRQPTPQVRPQPRGQVLRPAPQSAAQKSLSGIRYNPDVIAPIVRKVAAVLPQTHDAAPLFEAAARYPGVTAEVRKDEARDALLAGRATLRGAADQITGQKANDMIAFTGALLGAGGDGNFDQRRAALLLNENAKDAQDRVNYPEARLLGRDAVATAEFLARTAISSTGITNSENDQRRHQLLTNRPVEHVRGLDSLTPIKASAQEAVADYQDGDMVGYATNGALAASDIFLAKSLLTGGAKLATGKAIYLQPKKGLLQPYAWEGKNGVRK